MSIDSPEFRALLPDILAPHRENEIIAHIDAHTAAAVEKAVAEARNDEREGIALFIESQGLHGLAWQVFAGMTRPADQQRRAIATEQGIKRNRVAAPSAQVEVPMHADPEWPAGEREAWRIGRAAGLEEAANLVDVGGTMPDWTDRARMAALIRSLKECEA